MVEVITAVVVMAFSGILQSAVVSKMPLLLGTADIILLSLVAWTVQDRVHHPWIWGIAAGVVASVLSGLPIGLLFAGYLSVTVLAFYTRRRIWKAPMLTMMAVVLVGTLVVGGLSILGVLLMGGFMSFGEALNLIVLPGLLLNLLLCIPIYVLVRETARWVYREDASIPSDSEI